MADEKEGFSLSKVFKKVAVGALKLATIGLAAAVAWQLFLDPLFFLPIHDPTNTTMQAWVAMINDWFGWIPDLVGATGDGGLLHTDFMQDNLAPYMNQVATLSPAEVATGASTTQTTTAAAGTAASSTTPTTGGFSLDDL